jgi:FkbM family methyltransferase
MGCAEVLGFEPLKEQCATLNQRAQRNGIAMKYLPWALGDGNEHTLHITNAPMTSSLLPPDRSTVDLFSGLGDMMQVVDSERLQTHRLDDIHEARYTDFLKLDVQGAELMILENAKETLRHASVIQCEVEFVELYTGQPLMADIDSFLRSQGFSFLRFAYTAGRPFRPLQIVGAPYQPISQLLWADAVYVRNYRRLETWSNHQLKATSFLMHQLYEAFDLTTLLLAELDRRYVISYCDPYLSTLLSDSNTFSLG